MGYYDRENGQQGGNSSLGRWITALIIALIGIFMYMSNVQINPVTGEKQYVSMTPNQEIQLGLDSAPQMALEMGGEVPSSDPRAKLVQALGQKIVENTDAVKSPWKFKFHLLKDESTVNAFALPGGQVFITLGLYNRLTSEAQLAGVLSHEMGHVIERHSAEQMATSQLGQSIIMAVATGASSDQSSAQQSAMIASVVNQALQLRYSRNDESEADIWGIKLMSQVGFTPRAMIEVMQILKEASGGHSSQPEIFQTHPNPDLRIKQIEAYLKAHPEEDNLSNGQSLERATATPTLKWGF